MAGKGSATKCQLLIIEVQVNVTTNWKRLILHICGNFQNMFFSYLFTGILQHPFPLIPVLC